MAKNVEKVIEQADKLIKQERYKEAWDLLLPHKAEENALKRLKWLKSKQEQLKLEGKIAAGTVLIKKESWFSRLGWRWKLGIGILGLCGGCICFTMFGQAVGFIPDATELAATKVAQVEITNQFLTVNAPTEEASPSAIPTVTTIATSSPKPSLTDSPSPTAILPSTASLAQNLNELRFENGRLSFTIQSFVFLREMPGGIQGIDFTNGAGVVILGIIENLGSHRDCLYGNDVDLILDGQEYPADDTTMSLFQNELNPYRDYLGYFGGHCVDANRPNNKALSFVAFDVPLSAQTVSLRLVDDEQDLSISWDALASVNEEISLEALYAQSTAHTTRIAQQATESLFATQTATQWTVTPSPTITDTPRPFPSNTAVPATATAIPQPTALPSGQTYYANIGDVKVRSCPQLNCEQLTVLQVGETIQVIGETTGDSAYNSTRWYEVSWNGRRAYVHSHLLSNQRPVATAAPVNNSTSAQNPPPVSQQWNCTGNIYNCGDFGNSCEQVMSYWNACPNDPSGLDDAPGPDGDGNPCESICGG